MSVLSGYNKYKRYIKTDSGYKLVSHWTNSNTVEFDDGKTAQTKLGAIDGITDSLASTSSNVALSAKAGKDLQDQCTTLNSNLATQSIKGNIILKDDGIDLLNSYNETNTLRLVGLAATKNNPKNISQGMALHIHYYTNNDYFTNIIFLIHLDTGIIYYNAFHRATDSWIEWIALN